MTRIELDAWLYWVSGGRLLRCCGDFNGWRLREITVDGQTWNRRYREYMEKIKTGSVFEIAEVLRDLSLLKNGKDLSFGEPLAWTGLYFCGTGDAKRPKPTTVDGACRSYEEELLSSQSRAGGTK